MFAMGEAKLGPKAEHMEVCPVAPTSSEMDTQNHHAWKVLRGWCSKIRVASPLCRC